MRKDLIIPLSPKALRSADALLKVIYAGQFERYTKIIDDAE